MEPDFWHQRWRENLTGFHQGEVNPYLRKYWPSLALKPGTPVFVPLCGKSLDMLWLQQQQHPVIGVELSRIAVEAFFQENDITPTRTDLGLLQLFEADNIRLYCGDFFDLDAAMLNGAAAVYDRASLIALPPHMRRAFVTRLGELLPAATSMLLVTLEYPQQEMSAPPFAVGETEVRELFSSGWSLEVLREADILADEPRFRERGVTRLSEKLYLLRTRPG
jgi:thiopurine S-methyltransferase